MVLYSFSRSDFVLDSTVIVSGSFSTRHYSIRGGDYRAREGWRGYIGCQQPASAKKEEKL